MKRKAALLAALGALAALMLLPVGGGAVAAKSAQARPTPMDLSAFSDQKPQKPLRMLFIHHSCGGQMFAPVGDDVEKNGEKCIYVSARNGGDLRKKLQDQGYEVHEASYGSEIGENTDMFDWLPKFQNKLPKIMTVDEDDTFMKDGRVHQIVAFKSCYPNNRFTGEGAAPGNPAGPELTVWNAKATLSALLPIFAAHPDTLFVYLTAPPNAPVAPRERLFKYLLNAVRGRPHYSEALERQGALARQFNTWVASKDGWLAGYQGKNVAVFDYYDVLTEHGASDLSRYATGGGDDDHPSSAGNSQAAAAFVPFLNRAVRRAGLSD